MAEPSSLVQRALRLPRPATIIGIHTVLLLAVTVFLHPTPLHSRATSHPMTFRGVLRDRRARQRVPCVRTRHAPHRSARLSPLNAGVRRYAIGAWQLAGNPERARELLDEGVRAGIPVSRLLAGEAAR